MAKIAYIAETGIWNARGEGSSIAHPITPEQALYIDEDRFLEIVAEAEQIDELSRKTLVNYTQKAVIDKGSADRNGSLDSASGNYTSADKMDRRSRKRFSGILKATNKLTKEEIEEIFSSEDELNELSKTTLASYVKKAHVDGKDRAKYNWYDNGRVPDGDHYKKEQNRDKGIERAVEKLAKEEVEPIAETRILPSEHGANGNFSMAKSMKDHVKKGVDVDFYHPDDKGGDKHYGRVRHMNDREIHIQDHETKKIHKLNIIHEDIELHERFVDSVRDAANGKGSTLRFADGHSTTVPTSMAVKAIRSYDAQKEPQAKAQMAQSMGASLDGFKSTVGLKEGDDFEQIDEISQEMKSRYFKKAYNSKNDALDAVDHYKHNPNDDKEGSPPEGRQAQFQKIVDKRHRGMRTLGKLDSRKEERDEAKKPYHAHYDTDKGHYNIVHKASGKVVAHNVADSGGAALKHAENWNAKHMKEDFELNESDQYHKFIQTDSLGNHNHIHVNKETGTARSPHYRGRGSVKDLSDHMFLRHDLDGYEAKRNALQKSIKDAHPKGPDAILHAIRSNTKTDWKHNHKNIQEESMEPTFEELMAKVNSGEQLDELSKKTLGHYISNARFDASSRAERVGHVNGIAATVGTNADERKERDDESKKHGRRTYGIDQAVGKLTGHYPLGGKVKRMATEELVLEARSEWDHPDVEFKKIQFKNDSKEHQTRDKDGNMHTWQVHHKGEHVGHMTRDEHEDHKMTNDRGLNYSIGKATSHSYKYHPGTERPQGGHHSYRKDDHLYTNRHDLSRHVATLHTAEKTVGAKAADFGSSNEHKAIGFHPDYAEKLKARGDAAKKLKEDTDMESTFEELMEKVNAGEQLDEVSKALLGRYVKAAKAHAIVGPLIGKIRIDRGDLEGHHRIVRRTNKRSAGIDKAVDKLTKEETIEEKKQPFDDEAEEDHTDMDASKKVQKAYSRMRKQRAADKRKFEDVAYKTTISDDAMGAVEGISDSFLAAASGILAQRRNLDEEARAAEFASRNPK